MFRFYRLYENILMKASIVNVCGWFSNLFLRSKAREKKSELKDLKELVKNNR